MPAYDYRLALMIRMNSPEQVFCPTAMFELIGAVDHRGWKPLHDHFQS